VGNPSEKQWETIDAFIANGRVDLAARSLRLNSSTVSRNLSRSHYWESQETIEVMNRPIGGIPVPVVALITGWPVLFLPVNSYVRTVVSSRKLDG
jgi:hypothetical protein